MRSKIAILAMFFSFTTFIFSYQEVKNLTLSAEGIEKFDIDCGAGFLKVYGNDSLNAIEVTAEIVVRGRSEKRAQEFIQKYADLSLEKRGGKAVLISKFKPRISLFSFGDTVINLTVNVPRKMDLNIDDGSGSIHIENITGNLDIEDGSGSLYVEKIMGDVDIEDSSGSLEVKDISGNLEIDDGSGSMSVRDIGGNVTVSDGSGSISIDGVEKDVTIRRAGSGGVRIKNVKGKVNQ